MDDNRLSIDELADVAGLTRRGIRYYVQQRLLPAPHGVGRGKHYDASHLARLRQIRQLQTAGHSLDEIRRLLDGEKVELPAAVVSRGVSPLALRAELWRRIRVIEGVELAFDAGRFNPSVEQLVALRDIIASSFKREHGEGS